MLRETPESYLRTLPPPTSSPVAHTLVPPGAWDDRPVATSLLLVDDDPSFLALATSLLPEMGAEVVATAPDAKAAVDAANRVRPDAALVDVRLPDRSGIDLAYDLAALPWGPLVVLMSTDRDAISAISARHAQDLFPFVPKQELANGRLRRLLSS
jgi:two-component system, chemotaxis family, protein-glutamate methylesterase/glutaminase